jgi:transcriptional regulator with XRE-family HTH domain
MAELRTHYPRDASPAAYVYQGHDKDPEPGTSDRSRRDEAKQRTGAAIRAARLARGLSQHDTARAAGITAGYLSAIENGHDKPSADALAALAAALGTTPEDLTRPGTRVPAGAVEAPPFPRRAGATRPVAAVPSPSAATGPRTPGPSAGEPAGGPGTKTLAERQKEQLAAIQAARSALAKGQRNNRARPWQGRDPYRNAVPGARKLPPERER